MVELERLTQDLVGRVAPSWRRRAIRGPKHEAGCHSSSRDLPLILLWAFRTVVALYNRPLGWIR
jgi:hypothetical protein